ncbi:MAG: hypothetical protein V1865_01055 [bacterium]
MERNYNEFDERLDLIINQADFLSESAKISLEVFDITWNLYYEGYMSRKDSGALKIKYLKGMDTIGVGIKNMNKDQSLQILKSGLSQVLKDVEDLKVFNQKVRAGEIKLPKPKYTLVEKIARGLKL